MIQFDKVCNLFTLQFISGAFARKMFACNVLKWSYAVTSHPLTQKYILFAKEIFLISLFIIRLVEYSNENTQNIQNIKKS